MAKGTIIMLGGYTGKILKVDLSNHSFQVQDLDEKTARKYIGGEGLAAKILWDSTTATTDPLSPQNPLIFLTGPITGLVPSSSRNVVAALSPLTNIWGTARAGGNWGAELKSAGFDGIVFTGKSEKPVYLRVNDGQVSIVDASHVWGKDVWETDELLRKETARRASVACIGPAGERLVRIACVINDGRDGRTAGRCGLGAVMGSKNLKAVVVQGSKRPRAADEAGMKKSVGATRTAAVVPPEEWAIHWREHRRTHWNKGRVVIKNWLEDDFPGFLPKLTETMLSGDDYFCHGCPYGCAESHTVDGRRRQVFESMVPLGSQCLIDDFEALQEAYDLCNKYGMDSISAGGVISFAIESFEKGLITVADTGGIRLKWGNAAAMVEMVRQIGESDQKFARLLGQGVRKAAQAIGGVAPEYAIHVKGLELPAHDPRSSNALALEYATANRGACHQSASAVLPKNFVLRDLGFPESAYNPDSRENRFKVKGRGELVAKMQDYYCLLDSLIMCKPVTRGMGRAQQELPPTKFIEWLNLATGWDVSVAEFLKTGERIFNLQRMVNARRGISRKDDMLPPRILTHKRGGKSEAAGNLPPIGEMLNEYYGFRKWAEEGVPTPELLAELELTAP